MANDSTCIKVIYHTLLPYQRAMDHMGDISCCSNCTYLCRTAKGISILAGMIICSGLIIWQSSQMYSSFHDAAKSAGGQSDSATPPKGAAGICVTLVNFWAPFFGAMVGGEVADRAGDCARNCFERMRNFCCKPKEAASLDLSVTKV